MPSSSSTCSHCRAPLLAGETVHVDGDRVFCCTGCLSARKVIDGLGLGRFDSLGGAPGPVQSVSVDDGERAALEEVVAAARARAGAGPCRLEIDVDGVSCASCAWLVEKVAGQVDGVGTATLNPARGTLELAVAPDFQPEKLAAALATVGHRVRPPGSGDADGRARGDDLLFRLGVTALLAMTSMIASFSLFLGLTLEDEFGRLFMGLAGGASFLAVVVGGWPFLRGALASVRQGAPTMDLPIATGMITASIANVLAAREGAVVSFDTVAVFVTLMLAGRLVERRLVWRHRELLTRKDADIAGLKVRRIDERGALTWRTVKDIAVADRLFLARGELVPVDGVIDASIGDAPRALSLAWLTGESEPVQLGAGAAVAAGAHVVDARGCVVQATRPFSSTRLSALLAERPRDAKNDDEERTVASGFFPWLARAWVVFAFGVAGLGALLWRHAPPQELLAVVAALLVVTCPCAFGIAAPLAVERATVLLRERGVFVRNARLWWRAFTVQHAVFDKTGTLTEDEPVVDIASRPGLDALSDAARAAVAAVVARSNHGRSRALARVLGDAGVDVVVEDVVETPGVGLSGVVGGLRVQVGRDDGDAGLTRIVVEHADGRREVAVVGFAEALRQGAAAALRRLQDAGLDVWVASGDSAERAVALAARVGVPAERVLAPCQPEDKAALVRRLGSTHVLVVGDGVNDAAMFEAAAVCGVPATDRPHLPARADFILLGSSQGGAFGSVVDVVEVARRLRTALIALLSVATVYNAAVVAAGLMGLLTPLLVALLMPAMSVSLLLLALALVRAPVPVTTTIPSSSLVRAREAVA